MVFEDFQNGSAKAADADLNAKLFNCGYSDDKPAAKEGEPKEAPRAKEAKETKETPEQRVDQKIKDAFGADVLDHLKDWDWLIENRKKLEDGFKKANHQDAWDMAKRMNELSKVDGKSLIYLSKTEGQTHGSLLPKRYDIYLRRGSWRSDNQIGQVYH